MQIDNTLTQYFSDIGEFPMLDAETEREYARRWRKKCDYREIQHNYPDSFPQSASNPQESNSSWAVICVSSPR